MLTKGFARVFGARSARKSVSIAMACDRFPFGGYPLWQANERWDTVSRRESLRGYRTQERYFLKLAYNARNLPAPLRASVELRLYFAVRDVFIRMAARARPNWKQSKTGAAMRAASKRYEQALVTGQSAARVMWRLTRDRRIRGANERIIAQDARRHAAWLRGKRVFGGDWQLCYAVHNFAPCLQLVAVEQQQTDGTWKTLQTCHTIEFQTRAAQPRGAVVREHAAPVEWDGKPDNPLHLRFTLRGLGAVKIQQVELRDGITSLRIHPSNFKLGQVAPTQGLPDLEWSTTNDNRQVFVRAAQTS